MLKKHKIVLLLLTLPFADQSRSLVDDINDEEDEDEDNKNNRRQVARCCNTLPALEALISDELRRPLPMLDASCFPRRGNNNNNNNNNTTNTQIEELYIAGASRGGATKNISALVRRGTGTDGQAAGIVRVLIADGEQESCITNPALSCAILREYIKSDPNLLVVLNCLRYWCLTHGASWPTRDLPPRKLYHMIKAGFGSARSSQLLDDGETAWRLTAFMGPYWNQDKGLDQQQQQQQNQNNNIRKGKGNNNNNNNQTNNNTNVIVDDKVANIGGLHPMLIDHMVLSILLKKGLVTIPESLLKKKSSKNNKNKSTNTNNVEKEEKEEEKKDLIKVMGNFFSHTNEHMYEASQFFQGVSVWDESGEDVNNNRKCLFSLTRIRAVFEYLSDKENPLIFTYIYICTYIYIYIYI